MGRIVTTSICFLVFGIVALLTAPSAFAGIKLTATVKGEDVLPENVQYLTEVQVWKQRARFDYEHAKINRDWNLMQQIEAAWDDAVQKERAAWDALRMARTRVVLYGDAAQRLQAPDVVHQLRATGAWKYATVHFWYERGNLYWGMSAPRGHYDNSDTLQAQAPYDWERTERHADDRAPTRRFDWSPEGRKRRATGRIFGM